MKPAIDYATALARLQPHTAPVLRADGLNHQELLARFHPDYAAAAKGALRVGVNRGQPCHPALAALLESNALIDHADRPAPNRSARTCWSSAVAAPAWRRP